MEKLQDKEWLRQKYVDERLSMPQIGSLLGVSKHPIYRALKKFGIAARIHTSKYLELNDEAWLRDQYLTKQKSIKQIADEIGGTVGTVHSALTHLGIATRGLKESLALKHSAEIKPPQATPDYDKLAQTTNQTGGNASVAKGINEILKDKTGIRLEIGGGANPNPGFFNIDILALPEVDLVWDLEETPWPLPDECALLATASHVLEHINPHKGTFIRVMDEIWRVLKPNGQFAFVVPHGESPGYIQDPTHCNQLNETTMHYFDPDPEGKNIGQSLYNFYRPKPWRVVHQYFSYMGNLEVLLEKRPMDKTYLDIQVPEDITREAR